MESNILKCESNFKLLFIHMVKFSWIEKFESFFLFTFCSCGWVYSYYVQHNGKWIGMVTMCGISKIKWNESDDWNDELLNIGGNSDD